MVLLGADRCARERLTLHVPAPEDDLAAQETRTATRFVVVNPSVPSTATFSTRRLARGLDFRMRFPALPTRRRTVFVAFVVVPLPDATIDFLPLSRRALIRSPLV